MMESLKNWKMRLSFKNATILVCFLNLLAVLLLLQGFFAAPRRRDAGGHQLDPTQLRYILESEEIRRAFEPLELIKRIKEIQQEAQTVSERDIQKVPKQTAAVDLANRLKDRAGRDASSQQALEEWRKRKMERARLRETEKNGTTAS